VFSQVGNTRFLLVYASNVSPRSGTAAFHVRQISEVILIGPAMSGTSFLTRDLSHFSFSHLQQYFSPLVYGSYFKNLPTESMSYNPRELAASLPKEVAENAAAFQHVFVDKREDIAPAVEALSKHAEIAFDTEGVNLGRTGALTVATF
jgi:hypothetical protein